MVRFRFVLMVSFGVFVLTSSGCEGKKSGEGEGGAEAPVAAKTGTPADALDLKTPVFALDGVPFEEVSLRLYPSGWTDDEWTAILVNRKERCPISREALRALSKKDGLAHLTREMEEGEARIEDMGRIEVQTTLRRTLQPGGGLVWQGYNTHSHFRMGRTDIERHDLLEGPLELRDETVKGMFKAFTIEGSRANEGKTLQVGGPFIAERCAAPTTQGSASAPSDSPIKTTSALTLTLEGTPHAMEGAYLVKGIGDDKKSLVMTRYPRSCKDARWFLSQVRLQFEVTPEGTMDAQKASLGGVLLAPYSSASLVEGFSFEYDVNTGALAVDGALKMGDGWQDATIKGTATVHDCTR